MAHRKAVFRFQVPTLCQAPVCLTRLYGRILKFGPLGFIAALVITTCVKLGKPLNPSERWQILLKIWR